MKNSSYLNSMENIISNIFGKSRAQEDLETIVKLAEEKHELKKQIMEIEKNRIDMFYDAIKLLEKRSPEDSQYFWLKYK